MARMERTVRKVVFPAAGLGTRFLPATKVLPKEMLVLVDKPVIQYGVEEAIQSGVEDIAIVTSRGKSAMEDHFDVAFELETVLERRGKTEQLNEIRKMAGVGRVSYVRQSEPLGLGHAVLVAKNIVGDEPFGVILSDDVIDANPPALKKMAPAQYRMLVHQPNHASSKLQELATRLVELPIHPGNFIVLAISIVIALLRAADFVARQ